MFATLWTWIIRKLSSEVPEELDACLDCGVISCDEDRFRNCPNRLARAAALRAKNEAEIRARPQA
jgi:hypothetical protein